jgi:hypothetical protein
LIGNYLVKTFPRQGRIIGGVVFYAVRVVLNESRLLVLPRTSCLFEPPGKKPSYEHGYDVNNKNIDIKKYSLLKSEN